jgi:hypothetical protein
MIMSYTGSGELEESNNLEVNKADVDENKSTAGVCLPIEGFLECRRRPLFYQMRESGLSGGGTNEAALRA